MPAFGARDDGAGVEISNDKCSYKRFEAAGPGFLERITPEPAAPYEASPLGYSQAIFLDSVPEP